MAVTLDVDCPNRVITLTWRVWADQSVPAADAARVKQQVEQAWNPTPPLRYRRCKVRFRVDLKQFPNPNQAPASYDRLSKDTLDPAAELDSPAGMGATLQPGGGDFAPGSTKHVALFFPGNPAFFDWNIPAHEAGHAAGISDPAPDVPWDESGITDLHIRTIIDRGSLYTTERGWIGWRHTAFCCSASADAITERSG
ncbi:MAG: hypothetical protein SF070_01905 [Gemmatimonadota bacterium]|nr:hypothetical protein [Gemmatimonadota bacterium]